MILNFTGRKYASRLLIILVAVTLIVTSIHLLFQYLNLEVFYQQNGFMYELSNRFDLDDESSIPTWLSQALFLFIGVGAAFAAVLAKSKPLKRLWSLGAVLGLLLSLDEVSTLHEFALQSLHNLFYRDAAPTSSNNAWLLVAPFILAAAGLLIWKMAQLLPRRTMYLFALSIFTFLTGAIFFDMLASIVDRETFLNQGIIIAIEESLELFGNVIALYAIADYLETNHGSKIKAALKHLK